MSQVSAHEDMSHRVTELYAEKESNVRSYCRSIPVEFKRAKGSFLYDADGKEYIDFFCGAGVTSYGHNPEPLKRTLIQYIESDGLTHGLDFHTSAKSNFIQVFNDKILLKRTLHYKLQFCGPTGTNGVEAALKAARKHSGRRNVFSFCGGFHGMSLGSLAVTGSKYYRHPTFNLGDVTFIPYPQGPYGSFDSMSHIRALIADPKSGVEKPAAVIIETTQAEGGIYSVDKTFMRELRDLCTEEGIVLIIDDVQAGCGRTGRFFSFEHYGIEPDMVVLSKALSGYALPFALVLLKEEFDIWKPGEHNGTFRGNQLAMVTAAAAIQHFWLDDKLMNEVAMKSAVIQSSLARITAQDPRLASRGIGMIWGIDFKGVDPQLAKRAQARALNDGLLLETCGRWDSVLKIMPALTIPTDELMNGLEMLTHAVSETLKP